MELKSPTHEDESPKGGQVADGECQQASNGVKSLFSKTKKKIKAANVSTLPPPPPPPRCKTEEESASTQDDGWEREYQKLDAYLKEHGLSIVKVDADGSCLFSSFAIHFPDVTSDELRREAVLYMMSHPDDFEPFIDLEMYPNGFGDYCMRMGRNTTWGSQLEIQALSQSRKVNVYVFQTGGLSTIKMVNFDPTTAQCVTVSYHDGQHYNSVLPIPNETGNNSQIITCDFLEESLKKKEAHESPPPPSYTDNSSDRPLRNGNGRVENLLFIPVYKPMTISNMSVYMLRERLHETGDKRAMLRKEEENILKEAIQGLPYAEMMVKSGMSLYEQTLNAIIENTQGHENLQSWRGRFLKNQ